MKSRFTILLIPLFIIVFCQVGLSQKKRSILANSNLDKYFLKTDSLLKYDVYRILDFENCIPVGDSMETVIFDNKLWFLFCTKGAEGVELFNIDLNTLELNQVTKRSFSHEDHRLFTLKSFSKRFFLTTNFSETEHVWDFGMLLIDTKNNKEEKYILVKKKSLIREMYIQNDSLYVIIQPQIAELNPYYFLTFWLPRERPMKYKWLDNGPLELFVYDKDFNLTRREEIPDYDHSYW